MKIGFLLGRAPGPRSVLPGVQRRLETAGATVVVALVEGRHVAPHLFEMDVVALRALDREALSAARELEHAGVRCCNSVAASALVRDKADALRALARAGLPVPAERLFGSWPAVREAARARPVAVKSRWGSRGDAVLVPSVPLPEHPPFPAPYLVQDWLPSDGVDRKLYVVGSWAGGVLRRWPPRSHADKLGRPFEPTRRLRGLACAAGNVLGLELFGVDVVIGPEGPAIVDVNAFPGYKGVPRAERRIADHLAAIARRQELTCAS